MELSRPIVVQHHGHLTLTLDFQGQILKMLYLRNGRADNQRLTWNKGIWVDWMLHSHCDFELSPHPWPWPWIFKVIFSCDQAALWMVFSVRPSVCPSVCLSVCLSHLFHYVLIIVSSWFFQEWLPVTKVTSMQKVKVRGQRSRSQRSRPNLTVSGL